MQLAKILRRKLTHRLIVAEEMVAEGLAVLVLHRTYVVNLSLHAVTCHLLVSVQRKLYVHLRHTVGITAGIDAQHLLTRRTHNLLHVVGMVVAVQNKVEAVNRHRRAPGGVLTVLIGDDALVHSRMEHAHDEVRVLPLLHYPHPLGGTLRDVLEPHALPHRLGNPVGNGRCDETEDSYPHPTAREHGIRLEVRIPGGRVHRIGGQHGEVTVVHILVEHRMARLQVVVSYHRGVIPYEVAEVRHTVRLSATDEVEVIRRRLALQHVAAVNKDGTARTFLALLGHIGVDPLQTAFSPSGVPEIKREVIAMDVTCEYYPYFSFFSFHQEFYLVTKLVQISVNTKTIMTNRPPQVPQAPPPYSGKGFPLQSVECLSDVVEDVFSVLNAHRQPDKVGSHTGSAQLIVRHLTVGVTCGMQHTTARVSHVRGDTYQPQRVHELHSCVAVALQSEGNDSATAARHVLLLQSVVLVALQS